MDKRNPRSMTTWLYVSFLITPLVYVETNGTLRSQDVVLPPSLEFSEKYHLGTGHKVRVVIAICLLMS